MSSSSLVVEVDEAIFTDASRYFIKLDMIGGPQREPVSFKTNVSKELTKAPTFIQRAFEFAVPPDVEPGEWSLEMTALAIDDPDQAGAQKPKSRVVGAAVLALGDLMQPLIEQGGLSRTITLVDPEDEGSGNGGGTLSITLRLEQPSAPPTAAPAPSSTKVAAPQSGKVAGVVSAAPSHAPAATGPCAKCADKARELVHKEEVVQRLMDDIAKRTSAQARTSEEVMELRAVNKQLESELSSLRSHMDERERAMEQLAGDATNVENIDLPQLQSRHRMLGAAYRADRRRMEQLSAQDETRRLAKYKQTAKQQEAIIQRLEALMAAALKDAKRVKTVEPLLEAAKQEAEELTVKLEEQAAEYKQFENEAREREEKMAAQIKELREEQGIVVADEEGGIPSEELAKVILRAERAERRAASFEEELTEMARNHGREVAELKMKLAEEKAKSMGGFGSISNLELGELGLPAARPSVPVGELPLLPPRPPSGSSRRQTPRLEPIAAPPAAVDGSALTDGAAAEAPAPE